MTFEGKRRLSFWLGFVLTGVLAAITVACSHYPEGSTMDHIGGFAAAVLILGFFGALSVSMVKDQGYGRDYWTDAGSRGNPYHVVECKPNLFGAFADGYVKFIMTLFVVGAFYFLVIVPK